MINLEAYGKYAYEIIRYLDSHGEVKKTDVLEVSRNISTVYRTLEKLQKADIIKMRERVATRRYIFVSLTDQGKRIAEGLRKAEEVTSEPRLSDAPPKPSMGKSKDESSMPSLSPNFEDQFKNFAAMTHFNVLDDHVAIRDLNFDGDGHNRVVYVYVKLNGNNIMRLWCEVDNTYDCRHTRFAWTLPDVQAMVQIQRDKGNINKVSNK